MISSAVLIPEEPEMESLPRSEQALDREASNPLKRRQSSASISSNSSKRPRLDGRAPSSSHDAASPPQSTARSSRDVYPGADASSSGHAQGQAMSPPPARQQQQDPPRRRSTATGLEQDKSRNRRLFGALLGTLSQAARPSKSSAGSSAARNSRREEIEQRQRERLKRENEEMAEQARRKRGELDRVRRIEQGQWDEEGMKIRHGNLRATARFLRTTTEPRLYYKPWELRPDEEATIKRQIEEAEQTIQREVDEFNAKRHPQQQETDGTDKPSGRRSPDNAGQNGKTDHDKDDDIGQEDKAGDLRAEDGDDNPSAPKDSEERPRSRPPSSKATGVDGEVTIPEPQTSQKNENLVKEEQGDRPGSKEDDHGGEELEQGREDDVIY